MVVGPDTFSSGDQSPIFHYIGDGHSNPIMIVEIANSDIHWMEPRDLQLDSMSFQINDPSKPSISSHHIGGAFVVRVDGSVRFLDNATTQARLNAMLMIAGGEQMDWDASD